MRIPLREPGAPVSAVFVAYGVSEKLDRRTVVNTSRGS